MLTQLELDTIDALYPNRDHYFEFLWQLSDRVQEESEVGAAGLRFLCEIRQRPFTVTRKILWWCGWGEKGDPAAFLLTDAVRYYRNYIPLCLGLTTQHKFPTCSSAVTEFLTRWCALKPVTREKVTAEWTGKEVECGK